MFVCEFSYEENLKSYCIPNVLRNVFGSVGVEVGWGEGMTMGDSGLYEVRTFQYVVVLAIAIFSRGNGEEALSVSTDSIFSESILL